MDRDTALPVEPLLEIWKQPDRYLARSDAHVKELHEAKKPSNWTKIDYLDFTAKDAMRCVSHGKLDALQLFRPMEVTIDLTVHDNTVLTDVRQILRHAVGSSQTQRFNRRLYNRAKRILAANDIDIGDYLAGQTTQDLPQAAKQELMKHLLDPSEYPLDCAVQVNCPKVPERLDIPEHIPAGCESLERSDTLAITFLENELYRVAPELREGLSSVERTIIGVTINNT